jgi:uncharacterized protein
MKKLLILLLLSFGFSTTTLALSENPLRNGLIFLAVDCRVMEFLGNDKLQFSRGTRGTGAYEEVHELLSSVFPTEVELIVSYLLPEDKAKILNGEEPSFAEVMQVTTRPNNCQGASYSLFEEVVANEISTLLKAEALLEPAQKAIAAQEAKLSSNPDTTEDKTIRVLMPHGPFIKEKNAFASTMIDFKHQTINGEIVETARLTTTLLIFIYDRILNVAFYSNWLPSSDLALHESEVKAWYEDFYEMNILNPGVILNSLEDGLRAYKKMNYSYAFKTLMPYAEQGNAQAQFIIGYIYLTDRLDDDEKNDEKAKYWFTKSAEQDFVRAQVVLANNFLNRFYEDEEKELYWYKRAAELGDGESQYQIAGTFDCNSRGIEGCEQKIYWLTKCTEKGYYLCPDALDRARQWAASESNSLQDGLNAYDEGDYKKAIPILLPYADSGKIEAQNALGHIYYHKGELKDDMKAIDWFWKAAEKGHKPSSEMLPILADNLIADGYDAYEKKDYQTVLDLWLPLAKVSLNGEVYQISWVQYDLGMLFYKGEIVQRDYEKAANMFKKSAEQGFVNSQFALGILYINGEGVMKSYKKAADWINKANENGHERAEEVWNKYELWKYE